MTTQPKVAVLIGSESDRLKMEPSVRLLAEFGVQARVEVMSAHRDPERVAEFSKQAASAGIRVIIAGAGLSAALPGAVAAHTLLPVIGVPLAASSLGGIDALLSIAQMPPGVPVACLGVDAAQNAALLAVRILALEDVALAARLAEHKKRGNG